ncbi:hypothetical protein GGI21_000115 [Coemansia aciculifera]|nr:hypothetical protein GGI21_000115 [Coemansia aciculifera]
MKLRCIAILNRQDTPVYMRSFDDNEGGGDDVKYQHLAHTSCDVIEERMQKSPSDMYLGLLQTVGELAVYGYVLNTGGVRIIMVISVPESIVRAAAIKEVFQQVHAAYIALVCNPFNEFDDASGGGGRLISGKFEAIISELGRVHSN